ncbi:alpha/beta fold hydrolase [Synechococcus sp. M16CYN]|uniref:esterase/lipase family protein n=1 Tax=Synechococcus sp. M16CYN TaxID=3103139 RepID=UPI003246AFE8
MTPLILIHGFWDHPRLFHRLIQYLDQPQQDLLAPHLRHGLGEVPLRQLAHQLNMQIHDRFGAKTTVNLLGFSMGGIVGRIWLQELEGACRTHHFFSVGSPHQGTITALPIPHLLLPGAADMKIGSQLLLDLRKTSNQLSSVRCRSFFCRWDLIVCPGWRAVLPTGSAQEIPVWTHQQLMTHPTSLKILSGALCEA